MTETKPEQTKEQLFQINHNAAEKMLMNSFSLKLLVIHILCWLIVGVFLFINLLFGGHAYAVFSAYKAEVIIFIASFVGALKIKE